MDAIEEIHPPTIAESLAQVGSMWMQSKLMDKMQLQPEFNTQLNEPAEAPPEVWPAAEPQTPNPSKCKTNVESAARSHWHSFRFCFNSNVFQIT